MDSPLTIGALLPSKYYDITAIKEDLPVIRRVLSGYARRASDERGEQLPSNWTIDVTISEVVTDQFTKERALHLEGTVRQVPPGAD
jgi:hypothetical protein